MIFSRVAHLRVARLLPAISLIVLCASCSDFFVSPSSTSSVALSPAAYILKAANADGTGGDTAVISLSATTVGNTTSDQTTAATWTSSAPAVATVAAGKVTIVSNTANKTAQITGKYGGKSATCNILTYTGAVPTVIVVNFPSSVSPTVISPGQRFRMTATATLSGISDFDISSYVTWSSNTPSVATIDSNGNVVVLATATSGNTFTITATAHLASDTVQGTSTIFSIPSSI